MRQEAVTKHHDEKTTIPACLLDCAESGQKCTAKFSYHLQHISYVSVSHDPNHAQNKASPARLNPNPDAALRLKKAINWSCMVSGPLRRRDDPFSLHHARDFGPSVLSVLFTLMTTRHWSCNQCRC
jgi:hypothetical protein